jgi:hypothetical protein
LTSFLSDIPAGENGLSDGKADKTKTRGAGDKFDQEEDVRWYGDDDKGGKDRDRERDRDERGETAGKKSQQNQDDLMDIKLVCLHNDFCYFVCYFVMVALVGGDQISF